MTQHPKLAALAVMVKDGHVLLVKRKNEPDVGLWGFPGGHVDLGETAMDAAARELREETDVIGQPVRYLTNVDVIEHDEDGWVRFHFLLAAVLCDFLSGDPVAQDDVSEAQWWKIEDVIRSAIHCSRHVDRVVKLAANL
ncbi:NUDIX hydrolase [uncultured Roseobacter sp.]|uniref:NUDIX hydrolase n=1 Tax=uncultured Roseobacter sp. TaxID=114847 RepID=UPI00260B2229|nr:NUDIX hydrolase [uncultured Roseobacter sp.]